MGFDACLVYDNGSIDRTAAIVRAFGNHHAVRLIDWPDTTAAAQPNAYRDCLIRFGADFDWIAFIDSDELIVPHDDDVRALLAQHGASAAIVLNWAMFGSSGHAARRPGLMLETFTRRGTCAFPPSGVVKYVVRPSMVTEVLAPCRFSVRGTIRTAAGHAPDWGGGSHHTMTAEWTAAQLNHYFTRSRDDWDRKAVRGFRSSPSLARQSGHHHFAAYDRNEEDDRSALRFLPAVREILDGSLTR